MIAIGALIFTAGFIGFAIAVLAWLSDRNEPVGLAYAVCALLMALGYFMGGM